MNNKAGTLTVWEVQQNTKIATHFHASQLDSLALSEYLHRAISVYEDYSSLNEAIDIINPQLRRIDDIDQYPDIKNRFTLFENGYMNISEVDVQSGDLNYTVDSIKHFINSRIKHHCDRREFIGSLDKDDSLAVIVTTGKCLRVAQSIIASCLTITELPLVKYQLSMALYYAEMGQEIENKNIEYFHDTNIECLAADFNLYIQYLNSILMLFMSGELDKIQNGFELLHAYSGSYSFITGFSPPVQSVETNTPNLVTSMH
ncbi:hypothetical protein [Thalassotalea sp. PLHSN55]|uniref:hypothetical protein n=1 Tax=Thalassotalea sp. PLHSN55 TaxID=3435888 RepID=UPI003F866097